MTARATSSFAFLSLTCAMAAAKPARAVDPFEIQVYDGSTDATGTPGLELHVNTVPNGRKTAVPPGLAPNHQTHFTLEPSLGIAPWWELGGYVQSSLAGDGTYSYAGVKLRSKFVTPKCYIRDWRFGVNLEVSRIPAKFDTARWGGEMRPIIAFENERWILAVNPILELAFAGPERSALPSFAPAMMAKVKALDVAAFGVEYYADLGSVARPDSEHSQQHYLFEAFDLLAVNDFEFNAGVGEGLSNAATRSSSRRSSATPSISSASGRARAGTERCHEVRRWLASAPLEKNYGVAASALRIAPSSARTSPVLLG